MLLNEAAASRRQGSVTLNEAACAATACPRLHTAELSRCPRNPTSNLKALTEFIDLLKTDRDSGPTSTAK